MAFGADWWHCLLERARFPFCLGPSSREGTGRWFFEL